MSRRIDQPEPGYYKRRLVRGGPWVGVRFFVDDAGELCCEVDGRIADVHEEWPLCRLSTETEFAFYAKLRDWALKHNPSHPSARPLKPIDLNSLPPRTR